MADYKEMKSIKVIGTKLDADERRSHARSLSHKQIAKEKAKLEELEEDLTQLLNLRILNLIGRRICDHILKC